VDKVTLHCRSFMWVKGPHPCRAVAIESANGHAYRAKSSKLATRIAAGKLAES
jgi:hypothetical protein